MATIKLATIAVLTALFRTAVLQNIYPPGHMMNNSGGVYPATATATATIATTKGKCS